MRITFMRSLRLTALAFALWGAALATEVAAQGSVEDDRAVLVEFYDATDGANWVDSTNWKTEAPLGEWFGVTTDTSGRVQQLDLRNNRLSGSIPDSLGNLSNLEQMALVDSQLERVDSEQPGEPVQSRRTVSL